MVDDGKRYYWIKLQTDFFNGDEVDYLMSQENGSEYIVLYLMLCLKSANTGGVLATRFGDTMIPYDVKKIVRETKYFDSDTVKVALTFFAKLGLIYEEVAEDGVRYMRIANKNIIPGSITSGAERKKQQRDRQKQLPAPAETVGQTVGQKVGHCPTDIEEEIDKEIEEDKEVDKEVDNEEPKGSNKWKQLAEDVIAYLNDRCGKTGKDKYRVVPATIKLITARAKEGATLDDFKAVIDKKCAAWWNDGKMRQYVRPSTLFVPSHFWDYLGEPVPVSSVPSNDGLPDWKNMTTEEIAGNHKTFRENFKEWFPEEG